MWKRRDWTHAGLTTLTAFTLTTGGYWLLGATPKDGQPPTTVVKEPSLAVNSCRITLHLAPDAAALAKDQTGPALTIAPGLLPQFQITVTNLDNTPATVHFAASLRLASMVDLGGREPSPVPAPVWHQDFTVTLKSGETQLLPIATGAKCKAMDMAMVSLEGGSQQVTALTLSATPPPGSKEAAADANQGGHARNVVFADAKVEFTTNPYASDGDAAPTKPAAKPVIAQAAQ